MVKIINNRMKGQKLKWEEWEEKNKIIVLRIK